MIKYSLRYRGPFEYDKMILNIFQFSNEVKHLEALIKHGEIDSLKEEKKLLDDLCHRLTDESGMMQKMLAFKLGIEQGEANRGDL